jgi:hypothetical protein
MQDRLDFARKLQELTNKIHGTDNIDQIMLELSSEISDLFLCERLTLYVYDKERGALVSKVKTGHRRWQGSGAAGESPEHCRLCRRHTHHGAHRQPRRCRRAETHRSELQFFNQVDNVTGFKSKQMLAAPLLQGPDKELVGVSATDQPAR